MALSPPRSYAGRGAAIGCGAAVLTWFLPLPVALIVWLFDVEGPFGDVMLMAAPVLLALPIIGAAAGACFRRRDESRA